MSQHSDDDISVSDEETSAIPTSSSDTSEARTDHSMSDSLVAVDSIDTFPRSEDAAEAHFSSPKCEIVENQDTADELEKMELSESGESSMHPPQVKNSQNSTSPLSSKLFEAFNLSIDGANQSDGQTVKFPLSPKRRHPSSKDEPDFKKLNTSAELNLRSSGEEAEATHRPTTVPSETVTEAAPQNLVVNPEASNLEQRADFQGGSTASNVVDDRSVFKVPAVPPIREKKKVVSGIVDEHLSSINACKDNPLLASMIFNQKKKIEFSVLLHGLGNDASAESSQSEGDASAESSQSEGDASAESSQSEGDASVESSQSVGDVPAESSQSVGPSLTQSNLVREIETIVSEYLQSEIPTWPPGGYDNPILRTFLADFTSIIQKFRNILTQSLTRFRSMVTSPYLNVSSLAMTVNELIYASAHVEIVWQNYDQLREENPNSVVVINMIEHYCQYIHCLYELIRMYSEYVANLPKDYPGKVDSGE